MENILLACGHNADPFGSPMCSHLQRPEPTGTCYVKWYTGHGMDHDLVCFACAKEREQGITVSVSRLCGSCFEGTISDAGHAEGVRGAPEIRIRDENLQGLITESPLPREAGMIVDIAPLAQKDSSSWLMLSDDGRISRFDADNGEWTALAAVHVPDEPDHKPWCGRLIKRRLYASSDGMFAAILNDFGRFEK